jgi:predicted DNA-binding transcriptional regulator AlpA
MTKLIGLPSSPANAGDDGENLWDVARAAGFFGMSKSWVYREAEGGNLPYRRIGGRLRFVPAELRAWADRQRGAR